MGLVYAEIKLSNPRKTDIEPITVKSLVDTGALHLCIPGHIAMSIAKNTPYQTTPADGYAAAEFNRYVT